MRFLLLVACAAILAAGDGPQFTSDGQLQLPKDYREWVFLTAGLGMNYGSGDAAEPRFDNVFVNRDAYAAFMATGKWPDKTMFVLEVRKSQSKGSINQGGRFQTDVAAIEAEVKSGDKWTFYGFRTEGGAEGVGKAATQAVVASCVLVLALDYVLANLLFRVQY